jgi:hypothetical protein
MKLYITTDSLDVDENITFLLSRILSRLSESDHYLEDKVLLKADVMEDLEYDRMETYYTDETISEVIEYTLDFINQKKSDNDIHITLKDYRVSINTLNRIYVIMKFLIGEKKI